MTTAKRKKTFGNPSAPDFKVSDYPFYLMSRVEHRYYAIMDRVFKEDKISRPVWRILLLLRHNRCMSITDLAEHTAIMRPTVSRILGRMEKDQLVERQARSDDKRITDIYLRPKGRKVIDKVVEDVAKQYEWAVSGLSNAELKAFNNVLQHIMNNISGFPWRHH